MIKLHNSNKYNCNLTFKKKKCRKSRLNGKFQVWHSKYFQIVFLYYTNDTMYIYFIQQFLRTSLLFCFENFFTVWNIYSQVCGVDHQLCWFISDCQAAYSSPCPQGNINMANITIDFYPTIELFYCLSYKWECENVS